MRILKSINNNVVSALDDDKQEVIVQGKGIGFRAIAGDMIPPSDIEKVFRMENQFQTDRLKDLFTSLPIQMIKLADGIISYAKDKLGMHLNQSIYITLTDHINFAVRRYRQGIPFSNPLLMEVRRFYPQEYNIGQYALEEIGRTLGIQMPTDEAAAIALHIVNAEYDSPTMSETLNMTRLIQAIIDLVKEFPGFAFDDTSMDYERFITHLKYLVQRMYRQEDTQRRDAAFVEAIASIYPIECAYSAQVAEFVQQKTGHCLSAEERSYLAVHLRRITREVANDSIVG